VACGVDPGFEARHHDHALPHAVEERLAGQRALRRREDIDAGWIHSGPREQLVHRHRPPGGDEAPKVVLDLSEPLVVRGSGVDRRPLVFGEDLQEHKPGRWVVSAEFDGAPVQREPLRAVAGRDEGPGERLQHLDVVSPGEFMGTAGGADRHGHVAVWQGVVGENAPGQRVEGEGVFGMLAQDHLGEVAGPLPPAGLGEDGEVVVHRGRGRRRGLGDVGRLPRRGGRAGTQHADHHSRRDQAR